MQDALYTTRKHDVAMLQRRFALSLAALMYVAPVPVIGQTASAPADGAMSVRIYPSALVSSDAIRLKDIGKIEGPSASTAGEWTIVAGLHAGETYVVEIETVPKVLKRRGVNLGLWIFRGHSRCRVQRVQSRAAEQSTGGGPAAERINGSGGKDPLPLESSARRTPSTIPEYLRNADPNSLDAELRRHIGERLASLGGEPIIRFSNAAERYLKLTKPTYHFKITDGGQRLLGMVPFQVTILEGEVVRQTTQILAEVVLEKNVVVARHVMNRGHVITAEDVGLRSFPFDDLGDVQFTDTQPLIGQRARKLIDQGAQISPRDIEPVPLVQRNDLVTVWVRRGHLVIKSTAKAMDSAGYGEPVELKNGQTREYFTGIVTGVRTVELPAPKPDSTLALADTRNKREKK